MFFNDLGDTNTAAVREVLDTLDTAHRDTRTGQGYLESNERDIGISRV